MTITQTALTSGGDDNDATVYTTLSVSPTADNLVLVSIMSNRSGGGSAPTSIVGAGLTFTEILTRTSGDNSTSVWRALDAAPGSGTVAITFPSNRDNIVWAVSEFAGVDTGGTNGADAIVQSDGNDNAAQSSIIVTLAAFSAAGNATFGAHGYEKDNREALNATPGTGFAEIHDVKQDDGVFNFMNALETAWRDDNDTTVDVTWSVVSDVLVSIALELKAFVWPPVGHPESPKIQAQRAVQPWT